MTFTEQKKENKFFNIVINIVVPVLVLTQLSGDDFLGQKLGLVVALAFPFGYGFYELITAKRYNIFSIIGVISIVLTGGIGLLELDNKWLVVKEAAVPLVIGVAVLLSQRTRWPLMKVLLDAAIDHQKVDAALASHGTKAEYEYKFKIATRIIAGSFFLSSVLNYALAKIIVVSPPGTVEYNAELGRMTGLSYPVIALPSMIIFIAAVIYLVMGIEKITSLKMQDIIKQ